MKRLYAVSLVLASMTTMACQVDPGSDLEDAPDPMLGSASLGGPRDLGALPDAEVEESTDVTGRYDVIATLEPAIGEPVEVMYLFDVTQTGEILAGSAVVDVAINDPMNPDVAGPSFTMPAPVSMEGAFAGVIEGLVISKDFTELLAEDANSRIELEGTILSEDCFTGPMTLTLVQARLTFSPDNPMDVPLTGSYRASRQGSGGCSGSKGMNEADMSAQDADMGGEG